MSYIQGTLSKVEKIKAVAKLHWMNYVKACLNGFIGFFIVLILSLDSLSAENISINDPAILFGIGIGTLLFICLTVWDFLKLKLKEMVVTNKRVVCRTGVISINTEELKNQKIESVEIKQSLFGRIFGYADIWFSGTGTSKVAFRGVADPWKLKSKFEEIVGD